MFRTFLSRQILVLGVLGWIGCAGSTPPPQPAGTPASEARSFEAPSPEKVAEPVGSTDLRTAEPESEDETWQDELELAVADVQGAGHRSPLVDRRVVVRGVITAVEERSGRFFIQSEEDGSDGDDATSEGLCVVAEDLRSFLPGTKIRASGIVKEIVQREGFLSVTCLELESFRVTARGVGLPPATVVGRSGRAVPGVVVDDDGLELYEPDLDGIDFFESLEGMRVRVPAPRVVGPTSKYGEVTVVADGGVDADPTTLRGGLLESEEDANPERFVLSSEGGVPLDDYYVGDMFAGDVVGTLSYGFGIFRLLVTEPLPELVPEERPAPETTEILGGPRRLTVGSFNVLNLSVRDPQAKFDRLAEVIVRGMASPALICLQEIQDDSGAEDDGTLSAASTLGRLVETIVAAGGPRYVARAPEPLHNREGGRPGGNIRVGFLHDPLRVEAVGDLERLEDPAFRAETMEGWSDTRRPVIGTFRFRGEELHLVGLHLRSKGGDDRLFGARQPPIRHSEAQRTRQAEAVRARVDRLLGLNPATRVVVLGDLNETAGRPPLVALTREGSFGGLYDLVLDLPKEDRYTYVFQGQAGLLDHILVSGSLRPEAQIDIVHGSADAPARQQAGDHDPLVAGLWFP